MTNPQGGPPVDPADQVAAPEHYDLSNWPMLRGSSGEYLTVAADGGNKKNLLMRFKIEQVIPPTQAYPGVLYMQILQVNMLAYNVPKDDLGKLGELGQHLDTREYKDPEGHKVQAHLVQRLYLPIAIEPMSEDTALNVACKLYGGMLDGYLKACCDALGFSDYCDVVNLIQSIRAQGNAEKATVDPIMFTHKMWVEAKGNPAANAAWLLSGKSDKGSGFGGYALPTAAPKQAISPPGVPAADIALQEATNKAMAKIFPQTLAPGLTQLPNPSNDEIAAAITQEIAALTKASAEDIAATAVATPDELAPELVDPADAVDPSDLPDDDYKLN